MFIDRCTDVRLEHTALQDSGFWNLHLYRCRDVVIEDVRITIPSAGPELRGPSTDGIDIDSSQNVTVRKCYISNNDDNIALTPWGQARTATPPGTNGETASALSVGLRYDF